MSGAKGVAVCASAYAKMVSHALRHHRDPVCGLLIGPGDQPAGKNSEIICAEAVPLLHTHFLHPQLRLGVELVETLCEAGVTEESGGFFSSFHENKWSKPKIVGFYYADILTISDRAPIMNKEASHIAQVLRQHYPQLVVCLLDFKRMPESKPVTTFWAFIGSNWTAFPTEVIRVSEAALQLAEKTIAEETYLQLADLDDHLADPALSPLNSSLFLQHHHLISEDAKNFRSEDKTTPKAVANEA